MKPRIPVPRKPNKVITPKTVYNRKHLSASEFVDWLGTQVKPKHMSIREEEEYHKNLMYPDERDLILLDIGPERV